MAVEEIMDIFGQTLRKTTSKELAEEVTRSYVVGLRFTGKSNTERRSHLFYSSWYSNHHTLTLL